MLCIVICRQIGQPRRNVQVPRNIQPAKTESKRNSLNRLITRSKIVCVIEKKKPRRQLPANQSSELYDFSRELYQTYKEGLISFSSYSKDWRGGKISKVILWSYNHSDTKDITKNYRPIS